MPDPIPVQENDGPYLTFGLYNIKDTANEHYRIVSGICFGCSQPFNESTAQMEISQDSIIIGVMCRRCGHKNILAHANMRQMKCKPL